MVPEQVRLQALEGPPHRLTLCRRAKIKNTVKKSIESGEDCNDIPDSMRRYLALQATESGKSLGRDLLGRNSGAMAPHGNGSLFFNGETSSAKVGEQHRRLLPHRIC